MIITKRALPRRTFLRGMQAAVALPLLDAMVPAATAMDNTPAKTIPRLGFVFVPMGCDHSRWTPKENDQLGTLTPILSPLAKLRMAAEFFVRKREDDSDESLAGFVIRRFGRQTYDRLVQPLIGGIYTENQADDNTGIPWMKDIPILGWLFGAEHKTFEKAELLIFL